jgi:hypothetical protein
MNMAKHICKHYLSIKENWHQLHSPVKIMLFATIPYVQLQMVTYATIFQIWMDFGLPFN